MKREVETVLEVYGAILMDYRSPAGLSQGDIISLKQLNLLIETRGLGVIYKDLPLVLVLIDRSLTDGFVSLPILRRTLGATRQSNYPRIFREIFEKIYTEEGQLRADLDATDVFFLRQLLAVFKKVRRECSPAVTKQAFVDFIELDANLLLDSKVGTLQSIWEDPYSIIQVGPKDTKQLITDSVHLTMDSRSDEAREKDLYDPQTAAYLLMSISDIVVSRLPRFDEETIIGYAHHGPGATSEKAVDKYHDLLNSYDTGLDRAGIPRDLLSYNHNDPRLLEDEEEGLCDIPVRILAVPKTLKGPRIIGAESVARMYLQQGIREIFARSLASVTWGAVNISDQSKSQLRAQQGSKDGSFSTIDLSSASDYLSLTAVSAVFRSRSDALYWMAATRAHTYSIDQGGVSHSGPLRKFGHMGSAVTFPVQSLVYAVMATTAIILQDLKEDSRAPIETGLRLSSAVKRAMKKVTVFGDDIIVPSTYGESTQNILQLFGMRVNQQKSHLVSDTNHFRESCGFDGFNGYKVNPIYITEVVTSQTQPENTVSMVECANNLHREGLWHTASVLRRAAGNLCVPISSVQVSLSDFTFSSGVLIPRGSKRRWSTDHHVWEWRVQLASTKGGKRKERDDGFSNLLQFDKERNPQVPKSKLGFSKRKPKVTLKYGWIKDPSTDYEHKE